jgi:hypothetical protein
MLKIEHKLGNFALDMSIEVDPAGVDKVLALGLKKAVDAAATPFFKGLKGADGKPDRCVLPYSGAKANELAEVISKAFTKEFEGAVGIASNHITMRVLTNDRHAAQKAAYERYQAGVAKFIAKGLSQADAEEMAKDVSGWNGVVPGASPAAEVAAPTEEVLE